MKKMFNKIMMVNGRIRSVRYQRGLARQVKECEMRKKIAHRNLELAEKYLPNCTKLIKSLRFEAKMADSFMPADLMLFHK